MGTTFANGVWLPTSSDPIDWHVTPTLLGAAADHAISGRSDDARARRTWVASGVADANAIKDAVLDIGSRIFRTDLQQIEVLKSDGWRVTQTLRANTFTPDWAGLSSSVYTINPGSAQQAWCYWVTDDIVTVHGVIVFSSNTMVGASGIGILLPLVPGIPPRLNGGDLWSIGEAIGSVGGNLFRGSITGFRDSIAGSEPAARIIFRGAPAEGTRPMTQDFPSTWTQGSVLATNFQYQTY